MATSAGPNISLDGLVFGYDTGYPMVDNDNSSRFSKGETTENLIYDMGGTVTSSYPEVVYRCTANETNVVDTSVPGGKYSRFTGVDGSSNNQLYSRFSSYSIDVRGESVNYSVYLKGSGTCHLTIYDNQSGYGTSSTITLTSNWVRYNYTRTINASATSYWVAVRGVLNTTDVYIAGQQAMRGTHSTPYVEDTRSSTQSLIDLKETTEIDLTNVSFDSNAQLTFDGTDDVISLDNNFDLDTHFNDGGSFSIDVVVKMKESASQNGGIVCNQRYKTETDPAGFGLVISSTNKYGINLTNNTPESYQSLAQIPFNQNEYHHITYTFEKNLGKVVAYSNGSEYTSSTSTSYSWNIPTDSTRTLIGKNTQGGWGNYINMDIVIAKIYNISLTAEEVKQNYNAYKKRFGI